MKVYKHNIPKGYLSFDVGSIVNKREYGLAHMPDHPHVWPLFVAISADNLKSAKVDVSVDMNNKRFPVSCELAV